MLNNRNMTEKSIVFLMIRVATMNQIGQEGILEDKYKV